jgi:hypothetical protein
MIIGSNTIFESQGRTYHLQAEDLGGEAKVFEVRVYEKGTVLFQKRVAYADLVDQGLPQGEFETALRTRMEKTLLTVEAAIAKGKLGG